MKNSQRFSLKWRNIIVVDVNQQPLKVFELGDDERLINPIARPKKRISLYKQIKDDKITQNEEKTSFTLFNQVIFSIDASGICDTSINLDFFNNDNIIFDTELENH